MPNNEEKYNVTESVLFVLLCEIAYEANRRLSGFASKSSINDEHLDFFEKSKKIQKGDLVMETSSFFQKNQHSLRVGFAQNSYDKATGSISLKLLDGREMDWTNSDFINIGFMLDKKIIEQLRLLASQKEN